VERTSGFDETVDFAVDEFGHHFGSFQNLECHGLKGKLLDIEYQGTGRVLLSTFYSNALAGTWEVVLVRVAVPVGALGESVTGPWDVCV